MQPPFYEHLKKGLTDHGLTTSKHDHCLFYSTTLQHAVLTYVDDCILFAKKQQQIDSFIENKKNVPNEVYIGR